MPLMPASVSTRIRQLPAMWSNAMACMPVILTIPASGAANVRRPAIQPAMGASTARVTKSRRVHALLLTFGCRVVIGALSWLYAVVFHDPDEAVYSN